MREAIKDTGRIEHMLKAATILKDKTPTHSLNDIKEDQKCTLGPDFDNIPGEPTSRVRRTSPRPPSCYIHAYRTHQSPIGCHPNQIKCGHVM